MKRAKTQPPPAPKKRNPHAHAPLLRKGGPHGKTTAAKRREQKVELARALRDPESS